MGGLESILSASEVGTKQLGSLKFQVDQSMRLGRPSSHPNQCSSCRVCHQILALSRSSTVR